LIPEPGQIWRTDFGERTGIEPAGVRPALVVGPPADFGPDFPSSIVVPLTTLQRGLSIHVGIEPAAGTGLGETSYAQCEQLRSVDRTRLIEYLGLVAPAEHDQIFWRISTLLDDWS
jgi:mRNA interferase MazF